MMDEQLGHMDNYISTGLFYGCPLACSTVECTFCVNIRPQAFNSTTAGEVCTRQEGRGGGGFSGVGETGVGVKRCRPYDEG